MGSSKNFGGRRGAARGPLDTRAALEGWVQELAADVAARLEIEATDNGRVSTPNPTHYPNPKHDPNPNPDPDPSP